jgi:hypothetical protein
LRYPGGRIRVHVAANEHPGVAHPYEQVRKRALANCTLP